MKDEDLPLLGEPLAIELVNTWTGEGPGGFDVLGPPALARRWAALALGPGEPPPLPELRALRDAARSLVIARAAAHPLDPAAVAVVNAAAAQAQAHLELVVDPARPAAPTARSHLGGGPLARLATSCVEVLCGPDPLRRCEGPGCSLFFVQHHKARRYCHEGCSHRARQLRYARRSP
jgi:predicted RNA-binding Zn ribbon-like protein